MGLSTIPEHIPTAAPDRTQAEEALRRNAEAFAALVEQAPLGIYTVDSEFRVRNVSAGAMPAFRNVHPLIGRDFGEVMRILWPESFASEAIRIFRHTLETGEPYVSPGLTEKRNDIGAIESYEWQVNRVTLADGRPGVVCYYFDTTRLQQAHRAVRESEERFRAFINATSNIVYRMSPDWSEMRYLDGKEFIADTRNSSRTWVDKYIHPEDQRGVMAMVQRAIQSKSIFELEHRVIRADGSLGWICSRAIPIFDEGGAILEWFGAASDVTQRKQAEEALRRQQERAEFVADASDVGFWFCDLPFDKLIWDKRVKNHFWLPPEADVTIQTFYERLHPDDREPTRHAMERSMASNTLYDVEYRTVAPDGRQNWIRAIGRTSYNGAGQPICFDGITQDVTNRKHAEEALRASEAKYKNLFENMAEEVHFWKLVRDESGQIKTWRLVDANPPALRTWGKPDIESIRGQTTEEIFGATMVDHYMPVVRKIMAEGRPHSFEDYNPILDKYFRFTSVPLGEYFITTGADVTAIKRAEIALRASESSYRELAENLDQQVQARTLELEARNREILRTYESLRTLSTRMMQVQDDERRRIARDLHDSAGQLLVVIDMQLSSLAQELRKAAPQFNEQVEETERVVQQLHKEIRTTSYLLHPPLLDEAGLYSALTWYVEGLNKRSDVKIALEIAPNFGRLPRDVELVIFRLVQESLANIYRHSGSKTGMIRIARDEGTIEVEVQDQGRGIPPEKVEEIQSEGSGVGIRGMRERLRQFGGELRIESGESGTRVLVMMGATETPVSGEKSGIEAVNTGV
jgi:signal transduction histidine kinase